MAATDETRLQSLADVIEIAIDQPGEADHVRALLAVDAQIDQLSAMFDFREYEAGGGRRQ